MTKISKLIPVFLFLIILFAPRVSHAQLFGINNIAESAVIGLINIFNSFFARVVALFADVLNWTFSIQDITRIDVIQFAWSVSRDFANMFFILLLLIIAFATILRIEPYGVKKLLPKVLIVALLINFSLVGTGIIIDIGSTLGFFFVSGGTAEVDDLGANIAAALGIQNLNNYEEAGNAGLAGTTDPDVSGQIGNAFFNLMLTVIVSFLFIAMAGLMVVRLVALWILVMFVPLALVAWIVPAGQKYWSKWWDKFFAWAFFPAIFGIFIYFGLIIGNAFRADVFTELGAGDPGEGGRFSLVVQDFLQLIVVVMILFAGLTQAKSAGLEGAGLAVKWGGKAKDAALGQVQRPGKWAYNKSREKIAEKKTTMVGAGLERAFYRKVPVYDPKTGKKIGERLEARGGTKYLSETEHGRHVVGAANAKIRERRDAIRKKKEELKRLTKDPHLYETDIAGKRGDEELAAIEVGREEGILQKLHEQGRITNEQLAKYFDRLDELDMGEDFAKSFIDVMVDEARKTVDDGIRIAKGMQAKDWENARRDLLPKLAAAVETGPHGRAGAADELHKTIVSTYSGNQMSKMLEKGQYPNLKSLEEHVYTQVHAISGRARNPRDTYIDYIRNTLGNSRLATYLVKNTAGQEMFTDPAYVV